MFLCHHCDQKSTDNMLRSRVTVCIDVTVIADKTLQDGCTRYVQWKIAMGAIFIRAGFAEAE